MKHVFFEPQAAPSQGRWTISDGLSKAGCYCLRSLPIRLPHGCNNILVTFLDWFPRRERQFMCLNMCISVCHPVLGVAGTGQAGCCPAIMTARCLSHPGLWHGEAAVPANRLLCQAGEELVCVMLSPHVQRFSRAMHCIVDAVSSMQLHALCELHACPPGLTCRKEEPTM